MATSSITHNFVVNDKKGSDAIEAALDNKCKINESVKVKTITGADNVKLFLSRIRNGKKV